MKKLYRLGRNYKSESNNQPEHEKYTARHKNSRIHTKQDGQKNTENKNNNSHPQDFCQKCNTYFWEKEEAFSAIESIEIWLTRTNCEAMNESLISIFFLK